MGQLVGAIKGIGAACEALAMPVVSGNVSLYNGARGPEGAGSSILPTPTIGGVGLIPDRRLVAHMSDAEEGDIVLLVGGLGTHLGQSRYARELCGIDRGAPPPVDLDREKRAGEWLLAAHRDGAVGVAHDVSSGGLAVALAELSLASDLGMRVGLSGEGAPHAALFGEDQARYLVLMDPMDAGAYAEGARAAGLDCTPIGEIGGERFVIEGLIDLAVADMHATHEGWLPAYMDGTVEA